MAEISNDAKSIAATVAIQLPALLHLHKKNIDRMLTPFGISGGQSALLMLLSEQDGQRQCDLVRQLGVKAPSLTTMLNRMERDGLLARRKSEGDQRETRVYLAAKGRRAGRRMAAVIHFLNERNLAGFRQEEKVLLLRFLEHIQKNLEGQRDELAQIDMPELLRRRGI